MQFSSPYCSDLQGSGRPKQRLSLALTEQRIQAGENSSNLNSDAKASANRSAMHSAVCGLSMEIEK